VLICESALAININALYLSACRRELGVITGVDNYEVQLLRMDGSVIKVPRYEIIYWAYYPLDMLPIQKNRGGKDLQMVRIDTLHEQNLVPLIQGWPIDFSEGKISFLTLNGGEAVVDRESIWKVSIADTPRDLNFNNQVTRKYEFTHPYSFEYCPIQYEGQLSSREKPHRVYPQQILSDPVVIKKELDRLKKGHDGIRDYDREQSFYPVPQMYKNITSLGMWVSYPSRYGASESRTNLTPILIDEFSSGPFGYQRQFLTGTAPIYSSIHEEPQTQIYYSFKADYFHLQAFLDPNVVLVGTKYKWGIQDVPLNHDDRSKEIGLLEFGFDYGQFAFNFYGAGVVDTGINVLGQFAEDTGNLIRGGLTYRNFNFKVASQYGATSYDSFGLKFFRTNVELFFIKNIEFMYSLIYRNQTFADPTKFQYASTSLTNVAYLQYAMSHRFKVGAFLSLESLSNQYGLTSLYNSSQNLYTKGGLFGSLSF